MSDKSWEPSSLSHSISFYMLNNFCFHGYAEKSHSHTLALSHSHTLSRHAEQVLFLSLCSKLTVIAENCNDFFWTAATTSREFGVHGAASQLKIMKLWSRV